MSLFTSTSRIIEARTGGAPSCGYARNSNRLSRRIGAQR
jgi:hypothetical protein